MTYMHIKVLTVQTFQRISLWRNSEILFLTEITTSRDTIRAQNWFFPKPKNHHQNIPELTGNGELISRVPLASFWGQWKWMMGSDVSQ